MVIGLISYLMYLNWKLALFLFIAAPFIALIVGVAAKRLRKISSKIQTAMGDVTHVASETINGYEEVKSFGGENYEIERFEKASDNNRRQNLKLEATNSIASPLVQIFVSASTGINNLACPRCLCSFRDDTGTFIAFLVLPACLRNQLGNCLKSIAKSKKGLAAAEDIFSQIDEKPELNDGKFKTEKVNGKITFKDVSFFLHCFVDSDY